MDETTRRTVTWVIVGSLIAIIVGYAIHHKGEYDRMARVFADGKPMAQLEAARTLVEQQDLLDALDERPRWVQQRAALAIARMGSQDGFWEAAGAVGVLDDGPQARIREAMRKQGQVIMDLLIEAIQDKDASRRGACAGQLSAIGEAAVDPLSNLMDAWDDYVRVAARDQLNAILNARNAKITGAKALIETRKDWLEEYDKILRNPEERLAVHDLSEMKTAELLSDARVRHPHVQNALIQLAKDDYAKVLAEDSDLIVDDLAMEIIMAPPPTADQKQEAAKYLRRLSTAKGIVTVNKIAIMPAVLDQLLGHEDADVRATGCELLGACGNQVWSVNGDVLAVPLAAAEAEKMVSGLLDLLQNDPEWTVRRKAAVAVGRLRLTAMAEGATKPLIAALADPRAEVKAAAAQALGEISAAREFIVADLKPADGPPNDTALAAAKPLADALNNNRVGAASELAVALEKVGPPAIAPLTPALKHPDDEVRLLATRAVARIGTSRAVPLLGGQLQDSRVAVRQTASDALRSMAETQTDPKVTEQLVKAIPQLAAALADDDWKVYNAARDALSGIGADAVPELIVALDDPDRRVSYTVQQALADIGAPAVPALVDSLGSTDAQVLKWVSIALGEIGHDAIAATAKQLESNPNPAARAAAARALGGSGQQADAVTPLLTAADDDAPQVRMAVAAALVKLGNPTATPTLAALLQDEDGGVRAATMSRLIEWYDPPALAEFAKLLTDADVDVQRRAAILLAEHVGGQEELRSAVASATSAGEAQNLSKADMNAIQEAGIALSAGSDPASKQLLETHAASDVEGADYAAIVAIATVARKTETKADREWALGILEGKLNDDEPELQQTAAVAVAQARVPGILENGVKDAAIDSDVRYESIKALGLLGTDTSVPVLIPLCEAGGTGARLAAGAIADIGRRLSEESEGKSQEAMDAATTLLGLAIAETDPELKAKLGLSVAVIGEAAVLPCIDFLKSCQPEDRPFAASVIGRLGNVAVDPYLLRARNQYRQAEAGTEATTRDWISISMYVTGDKMARDFFDALPPGQEPPQNDLDAALAELEKLLDAM